MVALELSLMEAMYLEVLLSDGIERGERAIKRYEWIDRHDYGDMNEKLIKARATIATLTAIRDRLYASIPPT